MNVHNRAMLLKQLPSWFYASTTGSKNVSLSKLKKSVYILDSMHLMIKIEHASQPWWGMHFTNMIEHASHEYDRACVSRIWSSMRLTIMIEHASHDYDWACVSRLWSSMRLTIMVDHASHEYDRACVSWTWLRVHLTIMFKHASHDYDRACISQIRLGMCLTNMIGSSKSHLIWCTENRHTFLTILVSFIMHAIIIIRHWDKK